MKRIIFSFAIVAAVMVGMNHDAIAQCGSGPCAGPTDTSKWPCYGNCQQFTAVNTKVACRKGMRNKFQSQNNPWHGGYNYWRFNAPTALVVPPTATFQTSYAWGVGQTRSMPINHQFGTTNPGGGVGSQGFSSSPYLRSSTEQSGVYPVRAPWSHQ